MTTAPSDSSKRKWIEPSGSVMITVGLPMFSGGGERPGEARLYMAHYNRMAAVIAATRTDNRLLINLVLANLDKHGTGPDADEIV